MDDTDSPRWKRIEEIFHRADEQPAGERDAFLAQVCGSDDELRREVESLLRHATPDGFLTNRVLTWTETQTADENLIGQTLGVYRIKTWLGAGGMGAVYRGHDLKLERDVALKILPREFSRDVQRLARFRREAHLLASLNHPHIGHIYGFEEHDDLHALVLELVDGVTLADRIAKGPLPLDDALAIARQIAAALEAAHEQGVVHRDLKPANIKVTHEGVVKVLDFGLAKALDPGSAMSDGVAVAAASLTRVGAVLGTAAYMAPEQTKGLAVDKRCDIWAFGCVLYEMLTGRAAFPGESAAEIAAAVLAHSPDWALLPAATPPTIRTLVTRCLQKDPTRRVRDIGDARIEIEEQLATDSNAGQGTRLRPSHPRGTPWRWGVFGASISAVLVAIVAWLVHFGAVSPTDARSVRLALPLPEPPQSPMPYGTENIAISDDGARIAYLSGDRLWVRRMDQQEATPVNARTAFDPFFSPDGEWLGFFDNTGLYKVSVLGGAPIRLVMTSERFGGGTWRGGMIVFATSEGLFQVPESGGQPRPLVKPDPRRNERMFAWPRYFMDGRSILFTIASTQVNDEPAIATLDLKTLQTHVILRGGSAARELSNGYLVYAAGQSLKAVGFDAASQRIRGDVVSLPDVALATAVDNGAAQFAVSQTGTLVFLSPRESGERLVTLSWMDHEGREEPLGLEPGRYKYPRVSPDGTRVALDVPGANRDIWIWDLRRKRLARLTDGPTEDLLPVWSVDGNRVFFASDRAGTFDVYSQTADGATPAQVEFFGPGAQMPASLTPDGTRMIVMENFKSLAVLDASQPRQLTPLLNGDFSYWLGVVSPDGKWIAYESDEFGDRIEVCVRPFPDVRSRREKVSVDGGRFPLWGPKGRAELYYVDLNGTMMAAAMTLSPTLEVGGVRKLFQSEKPERGLSGRPYDISPLDQRFLITKYLPRGSAGEVNVSVVLNWQAELKRIVPTK
jgi:serine/threonine-protein kinase